MTLCDDWTVMDMTGWIVTGGGVADVSSPKIMESLSYLSSMSMTCSIMSESSGSIEGVSPHPATDAICTSSGVMKSAWTL